MTDDLDAERMTVSPRRMQVPLALAQFICSFAGSPGRGVQANRYRLVPKVHR